MSQYQSWQYTITGRDRSSSPARASSSLSGTLTARQARPVIVVGGQHRYQLGWLPGQLPQPVKPDPGRHNDPQSGTSTRHITQRLAGQLPNNRQHPAQLRKGYGTCSFPDLAIAAALLTVTPFARGRRPQSLRHRQHGRRLMTSIT